jgi:hypothetical protein
MIDKERTQSRPPGLVLGKVWMQRDDAGEAHKDDKLVNIKLFSTAVFS